MHNVLIRCVEKILLTKNEPSWTFEKAFFDIRFWILAHSEYDFLKIDKNGSQLSRNHFFGSGDAVSYIESVLGL